MAGRSGLSKSTVGRIRKKPPPEVVAAHCWPVSGPIGTGRLTSSRGEVDQVRRQRGHGDRQEDGHVGEPVEACAQMGPHGTDEKEDEPDGGGGAERGHREAGQQPERACVCLTKI